MHGACRHARRCMHARRLYAYEVLNFAHSTIENMVGSACPYNKYTFIQACTSHVRSWAVGVCVCVCACVCVRACMCVCMYVCMYACIYVCMYICSWDAYTHTWYTYTDMRKLIYVTLTGLCLDSVSWLRGQLCRHFLQILHSESGKLG
jgi:hypothetical protein